MRCCGRRWPRWGTWWGELLTLQARATEGARRIAEVADERERNYRLLHMLQDTQAHVRELQHGVRDAEAERDRAREASAGMWAALQTLAIGVRRLGVAATVPTAKATGAVSSRPLWSGAGGEGEGPAPRDPHTSDAHGLVLRELGEQLRTNITPSKVRARRARTSQGAACPGRVSSVGGPAGLDDAAGDDENYFSLAQVAARSAKLSLEVNAALGALADGVAA